MAATGATGAGTGVVNPQPQTTAQSPGGPFIRYSEEGFKPMYTASGLGFGAQVNSPLVSAPGYARRFRVRISATGGVNGTTTVAAAADAPWNVVQQLVVTSPGGTQLMQGDGYGILHLVNKYGGQNGLWAYGAPDALPTFSAVSTGSSGTGDFVAASTLPLEAAKGYGTISMASASELPTISWQLAASSAVFTTAPGTLPTLSVKVGLDYYWLPLDSTIEPPGLGSTMQWNKQTAFPNISSGSNQEVNVPKLGGYISTFIFVLRDSTGARVDAFPDPLSFYLDGVPVANQKPLADIEDDMANQFQLASGELRETGVLVFTRKTSLAQVEMGLLDTGEGYLSSNPGTSVVLQGTWGSITNSPATLSCYAGQFVPSGAMLRGLLEQ
jgi:hypothetical protein